MKIHTREWRLGEMLVFENFSTDFHDRVLESCCSRPSSAVIILAHVIRPQIQWFPLHTDYALRILSVDWDPSWEKSKWTEYIALWGSPGSTWICLRSHVTPFCDGHPWWRIEPMPRIPHPVRIKFYTYCEESPFRYLSRRNSRLYYGMSRRAL